MGYFIKNRKVGRGPQGVTIPGSSLSDRPAETKIGSLRYNTDDNDYEYYNGTEYVKLSVQGESFITVDPFTGDGVTVQYTLTVDALSESQIMIFMGGVYQPPSSYAIGITPTELNFSVAPPLNTPVHVVHGLASTTTGFVIPA